MTGRAPSTAEAALLALPKVVLHGRLEPPASAAGDARPGAWTAAVARTVLDASARGVAHLELLVSPTSHLRAGCPLAELLVAVDDGAAAGWALAGTRVALLVDVGGPAGALGARQLVEELVALRRTGARGTDRVVGICLGGGAGGDARAYGEAFGVARRAGLRRTARLTPGPAAAATVDALGLERVDGALAVAADASLAGRLADRGTVVVACPSVEPTIADPLLALRARGVRAVVGGGPAPGSGAPDAYAWLAAAPGLGWSQLVDVVVDAIDASWLEPEVRDRLRHRARRLGADEPAASVRPAAAV